MSRLIRILVLGTFIAHTFVAWVAQSSALESDSHASSHNEPHPTVIQSPDLGSSPLFTLSREWDGNFGLDRTRSTHLPVGRVVESADCLSGTTGDCGCSLVAHSDRHACRSSLAFFGRLIPLRN